MQCVEMLCEQVTTAFGFTSNGMTEWFANRIAYTNWKQMQITLICNPGENCCIWNIRELKQWWQRRQVKLNLYFSSEIRDYLDLFSMPMALKTFSS